MQPAHLIFFFQKPQLIMKGDGTERTSAQEHESSSEHTIWDMLFSYSNIHSQVTSSTPPPNKESFEFFSRIGGIKVSKGPTGFLFRNINLHLCYIFLSRFVEVINNRTANMSSAHYPRQAFLALLPSNDKIQRFYTLTRHLLGYSAATWLAIALGKH